MLATPVTSAPHAFAICTAHGPTLPEAPLTSTLWPGWIPPRACRPWMARIAPCGTVAASSGVIPGGIGANARSGAATYSPNAP